MFLKRNTSTYVMFFMPDNLDPWSGKSGLSAVTVEYCKHGSSSFSVLSSPSIVEIGNGFYRLTVPASLVDTPGQLALRFTASGAKPQQLMYQVVAFDPYDENGLGLSRIDATISSRSTLTAADVWSYGTRTLTSFGTLVSDIATAVWSASTRTLTSFGSLVSDIWNHVSRTLTGFGTLVSDVASAVWEEQKSGHNTAGSFGELLDVKVSSRLPSGSVTVGGYDTGAHPAPLVWSHPTRTLTAFSDAFADVIWNRLREAVARPAGSFADILDTKLSSMHSNLSTDINNVYNIVIRIRFTDNDEVISSVQSYANGMSPAEQILADTANKLYTDAGGFVVASQLLDKTNMSLSSSQVAEIVDAVWDELKSGHNVVGSFGALIDTSISSRQPVGPVQVSGYATGQDPASLVWSASVRTLSSVLNVVDGSSTTIADQIWNRLRSADTRPAGSFGYFIDMKLSDISSMGGSDWTPEEKEQIRYALGIDGSQQAPTGSTGYLPSMKGKIDAIQLTGGNVHAVVQAYASGYSPADMVLSNPLNKIVVDSSGRVTVGTNQDKGGYSLSSAAVQAIVNAVWDESQASHTADGTFGKYLDAQVSSRHPSGNVTVGGYASGQSPADLILMNASQRLYTDSSGRVVASTVVDKTGYELSAAGVESVVNSVWDELRAGHTVAGSFGEALDVKVSSRHPNAPVQVGGYASGQSPAELILQTPADRINNAGGNVTVGGYASGQSPAELVLQDAGNRIYTDGSGNVRVGGYASGQSPANHVLVNPSNKLNTDASGRVTVGVNQDKSGYSLTTAERDSIANAVWQYVLEGSSRAIELFRMAFAVLFGKRTVSSGTFVYYGQDDTTVRVAGQVDLDRNRNITTRNGA
ncbi:MAG: hypothetical protein KatS3mg023_3586 [Armatimonadota bacterium]|nr:MAG: hypothetical protein KatS3mg023_3586 [Armatimonadota bacterium]